MAAVCEVCGKQPVVRHEREPLAPAHQAPLEPEHPAGPGPRRRRRPSGSTSAPAASRPARSKGSSTDREPDRRSRIDHGGRCEPAICRARAPAASLADRWHRDRALRAVRRRPIRWPTHCSESASTTGADSVQGVIKSYDPGTGDGVVVCDTDLAEYDLAPDALDGSVFRMLRQGQRVIFDLDDEGRATRSAARVRGRHGHAGSRSRAPCPPASRRGLRLTGSPTRRPEDP